LIPQKVPIAAIDDCLGANYPVISGGRLGCPARWSRFEKEHTVTEAPSVVSRVVRHELMLDRLLLGLLALALLVALAVLCIGVFQPLLDQYFARQTQTALTSYWLVRGGPIFAYETPVVGFPWSIPYEFPIYQIVVALLSKAGVPLDAAGRIMSFVFFLGCLWPMRVLFRALRFGDVAFLCVAILFLLCPLYLYWGRTFMVETCALFFSFLWLAYLARFLAVPALAPAVIATFAGSLGVLAKSTTFPTFAVLGGLLFLKECYAAWTARAVAERVRPILLALFAIAVPFAVGGAWTIYSDAVKENNEIGVYLTSSGLARWNFGTWEQRLGPTLWQDVILRRALTDAFGYTAIPAVAIIGATLLRREYAYAAAGALLGFFLPFLVFTNLHIVHFYYQTANAIFIIAATGLGLASVVAAKRVKLALVCLGVIVIGQLTYFRSAYAILLSHDFSTVPLFRIANIAKAVTAPDTSLVVIGDDWSSTIPYYAQRKSLVIPNWLALASWQRMLAAPQKYLDDVRLGGVVYCTDKAPTDPERKALTDVFVEGRAVLGEAGPCRLLAPAKSAAGLSSARPTQLASEDRNKPAR
jgi:hypothetical protein